MKWTKLSGKIDLRDIDGPKRRGKTGTTRFKNHYSSVSASLCVWGGEWIVSDSCEVVTGRNVNQ